MKGMLLAAGLGTRLHPLTALRPKPLFPVLNRPILATSIERLVQMGVKSIVINTHHLADQIERFVAEGVWGVDVRVVYEPRILGTGGGIKNCAKYLGDSPVCIIVNADIFYAFDLADAINYHLDRENIATLLLCDNPRFNQVGIDAEGRIVSLRGERLQAGDVTRILTFTGIHLIDRHLFELMPAEGFFDIISLYRKLISEGKAIRGYELQQGYWRDIGRLEDYWAIHTELMGKSGSWPIIHPEAAVADGAKVVGKSCVGRGAKIMRGAVVEDSIVWEDAVIDGVVRGCIVADRAIVQGYHGGEVLISG